jgi:hypothetical protein
VRDRMIGTLPLRSYRGLEGRWSTWPWVSSIAMEAFPLWLRVWHLFLHECFMNGIETEKGYLKIKKPRN